MCSQLSSQEYGFKPIEVSDLSPRDFVNLKTYSLAQRDLKNQLMRVSMLAELKKINSFFVQLYEPSAIKDERGNIISLNFEGGKKPYCGCHTHVWYNLAQEYYKERSSRLAGIDEYYLIIARLLKDKNIDSGPLNNQSALSKIADDSSCIGNYINTIQSTKDLEQTGYRQMGLGLYGFVGNTYKVLFEPDGFYYAGGCYLNRGDEYPLASIKPFRMIPRGFQQYSVGLVIMN